MIRAIKTGYVDFQLPSCFATLTKKHHYYFKVAAHNATKSEMNHKHGAVIVYKGDIISVGYNRYKNSGCCANLRSVHAEMDAIKKIRKHNNFHKMIKKCDIYVVRLSDNMRELRFSKPCCECSKLLKKYSFRGIYWS